MAIDTANQRASAIHVTLPWRGLFPAPDPSFDVVENDRAFMAGLFAAHFEPVTLTSTQVLQLPVDCVLIGDQQQGPLRPGRAGGRFARHIFRE